MHNAASAIFTQALWETGYLVEYLGGQRSSVYALPGAGDLYVTCQSGRNSRMGRFLGLGMNYRQAKAKYMPEDTVEGAELALAIGPTIETLMDQGDLDRVTIPLLRTVINIVCHETPPKIPWDAFFADV